MSQSRYLAAQIIHTVIFQKQSLTESLNSVVATLKDMRDRALIQAMTYGVCRFYYRLTFILNQLLKKPLPAKEKKIHALLLIGLYQLTEMRIPHHAAVTETVNAALLFNKSWAKNLVNAILREYLRREKELTHLVDENLEAHYAHPTWLMTRIQKAWPKEWQQILNANNEYPPFSLRVNLLHISREKYIQLLQKNNLNATIIPETDAGITLESATIIERLPGFSHGEVSVQDGGAQLSAPCLEVEPNLRVLDACAAPGGKLTHLLEREPTLSMIALEKDPKRMLRVKENLTRLQFTSPQLVTIDATPIKKWWDGQLFDRILLDVPCSASGVIRRHPDIKLLRRSTDMDALTKEQLHLLTSLWPTLKPGGLLLYITCSIFPEENSQIVQKFLNLQSHAQEEKLNVAWGLPCEIGRQILPGMHGMDGFYFARIKKININH